MRRPAASLLVLTALAGCQLHLAAQYDPTLDQGLSTTYQDIDALLSGIAGGTPSCDQSGATLVAGAVADAAAAAQGTRGTPVLTATAYASVSATYDKIDSALNTLELRAEAQPMNSDTSTALAKVKDSFDRLRQRHQAGTLDIGHAQDEYCILRADFRVLTQMELAKKR